MIKFFLVALVVCTQAYAVEGLKKLKFGMSIVEVRAYKYCKLEYKETSEKAVDTYMCNDFKYGNKSTTAVFFFIKNKLERVAIDVGDRYGDMESVASFLRDEYGSPSSMFDVRAIHAFNAGIRDELTIGFDDDTVILKLTKFDGKGTVTLTYSTDDYYAKILGERKRSMVALQNK